MAQVQISNVAVNGKPIYQYLSEEKSSEVMSFYAAEMKGFRKSCKQPEPSGKYIQKKVN